MRSFFGGIGAGCVMSKIWVYVTAGNQEDATNIAQTLVEERLVACANILGPTTAIYWWEGKVEMSPEVALILKTRSDLLDAVTEKIKKNHNYDCACIVALPIKGGNRNFLDWLDEETTKA